MIPYILHVTVITTICFLFYKLLLQKETFYELNRWTLLGCLAVSFGLPLLPVPRAWSWQDKWREKEVPPAVAVVKPAVAQNAPAASLVMPMQEPVSQQPAQSAGHRSHAKHKHEAGSQIAAAANLPMRQAEAKEGRAIVQAAGTATGTPVVKSGAPD